MRDLSAGEQALWEAWPHGGVVDLREAKDRSVRGEFIARLLLGGRTPAPGRVPALRLCGGHITGVLDLSYAQVESLVLLHDCTFEQIPVLLEATTRAIDLRDSRLPGLDARGLRTDGGVVLTGCVVTGPVTLRGGRIGGTLYLDDAVFSHPLKRAVTADNATIEGDLAAYRVDVDGELRMHNTRIAGRVMLDGARLHNPDGHTLSAGGIAVEAGVWLVRLASHGQIRMIGARLSANLTINESTLHNPGGLALDLERASLVTLVGNKELRVDGEVRLANANVSGDVDLSQARLNGPLMAHGITIDGSLLLMRLHATGEVRLVTGRVAGRLWLDGARFENPGDTALRLSRAVIGADLFCLDATVVGELKLTAAQIGRHINLTRIQLTNPDGTALNARYVSASEFVLRPRTPPEGQVSLRHARVRVLHDDPALWPERLELDGLTYETLDPRLPAKDRLRWLARDTFNPQPYEQLAAAYQRIGQHTEARRVLYAREGRQRQTLTRFGRAWSLLQDITVAYGYQPWRAALWLGVLLTVGSLVYGSAPPRPLGPAPEFNAVFYTLDLLLPIVDLGQERAYDPVGGYQWLSFVLIASGWVLATSVAAGVARVLTRR